MALHQAKHNIEIKGSHPASLIHLQLPTGPSNLLVQVTSDTDAEVNKQRIKLKTLASPIERSVDAGQQTSNTSGCASRQGPCSKQP